MPSVYQPDRPVSGGPFTFYVSPDGSDKNNGLSPERPWRTLAHANGVRFKPGDRLRLKGGERFRGRLTLEKGEAGRPSKPVVIDSYGTGRATIAPSGTSGIAVRNTSGVEIRDLTIVGDARKKRDGDGISFFSNLPGSRRLAHIRVSHVEVSHFEYGISVGADPGTGGGFRDVRITDASVHHNLDAGLAVYGPDFDADDPDYAHQRLRIERVRAHTNTGDPASDTRNTGSGIILGSVRDATVSRAVSYGNGARSAADAEEGPEGIWTYDSTRVVIENSRSYRNHTGSEVDGGGFGLDNNVSDSVLQYNLSYGNDGPGFLVYSGQPTGAHRNNTMRFNVSWDDARRLPWYGGIVAYGTMLRDLDIYHNTVLMRTADLEDTPAAIEAGVAGSRPPALRLRDGIRDVGVHNNVFVTDSGPLIETESAYGQERVRMQGNDYHSTDRWTMLWGDERYSGLDGWREATEQETLDGEATGSSADPCVNAATAPLTGRIRAAALTARCTDEAAGLRRPAAFGIDPGPVDYFGARLRGGRGPAWAGAAQPDAGRPRSGD
ncbi:right-handed parallel beta-helix repeat-containing protein [Streptomyces polyrhachis]|uniref:Right-handed parallel beta-helix repeat-containing protein n=1 Tax=Streptomyces polyrhachis TaxID=1282885 RepID=A0ABW2GJU4_9ACTN